MEYLLCVRRLCEQNTYNLGNIIAMDETPAGHDMLANATDKGAESV